ncbi:MAG: SoxR reducing system RseC family protein [Spirochaetaceae bacterium]|jgi:positive regulator of sigma E activity|nr:SoxR reducing system RseC family protein [Spirochaetaceae bacterium]
MRSRGIIKNISGSHIFVEICDSNTIEETSSCSSGQCVACGKAGNSAKKRSIEVGNPGDFPVNQGDLVELELKSSRVLLATIRVLIFPLVLFVFGYLYIPNLVNDREFTKILGGVIGLVVGFLVNFLISRKSLKKEMPEIVRIL